MKCSSENLLSTQKISNSFMTTLPMPNSNSQKLFRKEPEACLKAYLEKIRNRDWVVKGLTKLRAMSFSRESTGIEC